MAEEKDRWVWKYFKLENDQSLCQICNKKIKYQSNTNLMSLHLNNIDFICYHLKYIFLKENIYR